MLKLFKKQLPCLSFFPGTDNNNFNILLKEQRILLVN